MQYVQWLAALVFRVFFFFFSVYMWVYVCIWVHVFSDRKLCGMSR